jgi:nucleoporin POM152
MNATPERVTGAFPATPATNVRGRAPPTPEGTPDRAPPNRGPPANPLPPAPENQRRGDQPTSNPVVPLTILDAPTQRFYAFGFYIALVAWKLYEWVGLMEDEASSVWLFLKWNIIDLVFIMGLPELRIPWLELTQPACLVLFFAHAFFNFILMFNITVRISETQLSDSFTDSRRLVLRLPFLLSSKSFTTESWPYPSITSSQPMSCIMRL